MEAQNGNDWLGYGFSMAMNAPFAEEMTLRTRLVLLSHLLSEGLASRRGLKVLCSAVRKSIAPLLFEEMQNVYSPATIDKRLLSRDLNSKAPVSSMDKDPMRSSPVKRIISV